MVNVQTLHRRAARVLPEVIKTYGVLVENAGQKELTALLFPLRRKSNGAVLFRLSAETIDAMGDKPLDYLKEAMRAREGLGRRHAPFDYGEWRSARMPAHWVAGLSQGRARPSRDSEEFAQAYFTAKSDGKALLIVIPGKCLAVYLWSD